MMDKIIGVITFRQGVYSEVKKDASFTINAWIIVGVTALLAAIGGSAALAYNGRIFAWLITAIATAAFTVAGFALGCFVIMWVAKVVFNTSSTFDEIVRASGLARVWHAVGFLGIVSIISPALGCLVGIFRIAAALAGLAAWLFAIKEVLGMEWPQTAATVIIAWVVTLIVTLIAGVILGLLGLAGAAALGAFR